jgi:hypothetical protein
MLSIRFGSVAAMGALLMLSGCLGDDERVWYGRGKGIDRTTLGLTSGELLSANGTYGAGCVDQSGDWSVEIAGGATLDNPELLVVANNTACVLTLTELVTSGGTIAATPAIALTASYQASASAFGSPVEFYANARLSAVTFAADFVLTVLYSDDPGLAPDDHDADFAVVQATAAGQSVPAPDYTLDLSALEVLADVNHVVQTATGTADLTAGSVTGQRYVVAAAADLDTYAEIDTAYEAGTDAALVLAIPAAAFGLVGSDLTNDQVRTLIVANISSGVRSYQAFEITFHPPVED